MYRSCLLLLTRVVLAFAHDDLSKNKVATQSTTALGPTDIYGPGNAVDRDVTTCTRTKIIGENSPDKTVWWKVDLGGVYNIYSVNILFKNYISFESRQQGRFAGFSLYVSNTGTMYNSSLCYKDGPQLPPLNFTTTCITSGRYIIFYNKRIGGVTYPVGYEVDNTLTELCEVIVQACLTGCPGGLDWLPSLIYREETGDHRHFSQGYMACIRNTSGLSPKVFRMLWLNRRALVESSDSIAGGNNESFRQYQVSMSLSCVAK